MTQQYNTAKHNTAKHNTAQPLSQSGHRCVKAPPQRPAARPAPKYEALSQMATAHYITCFRSHAVTMRADSTHAAHHITSHHITLHDMRWLHFLRAHPLTPDGRASSSRPRCQNADRGGAEQGRAEEPRGVANEDGLGPCVRLLQFRDSQIQA